MPLLIQDNLPYKRADVVELKNHDQKGWSVQEEIEDTKEDIRIRSSKKNIQHNDKQRSTQHTHKIKDRATRSPLKTGGELRCSEG